METIAVDIDGKVCATYQGLAGTFAGFTDCCTRKQVLPGFHQKDLIVGAERKGRRLVLLLSGGRPAAELIEMMEAALHNMMAFPGTGGEAEWVVEVRSEK
ncbi:MAG: hypothetical protein CVU61_12250 [Deltaproteobacteria bacterium HGW-Deltaproteobacteria-19]|jgi:hypothetical protein|nr:MAG: hypothetical protein CVU61_12250 [Deltaproteobacteria bacterium HGW-Deltaproteobacteria-19]